MSAGRVLVAGVGNVFFRDDAFGVAVVEALKGEAIPEGVTVADFGIRGMHLAYEIVRGYELVVVVDAVDRKGNPGDLYVIEPDLDAEGAAIPDAHSMELGNVFAMIRSLGGSGAKFLLVGCQPADAGEGMGLSEVVAGAVPAAVRVVVRLLNTHSPEVAV